MKQCVWLLAGLLALGATTARADDAPAGKKKLLVITESRGFRHGVVTRKVALAKDVDAKQVQVKGLEITFSKDGKPSAIYRGRAEASTPFDLRAGGKVVARVEPCLVESTFMDLAKKTGLFDVVCSQDSRSELTAENLKNFDAVFFYTTGELPLSDTQKADFLAFIRGGKGFMGSHCATDTFYKWKEYGELIGAYFAGHPPGYQKIRVLVEDTKDPATRHLGKEFAIEDEIYKFRDYSPKKVHVLMRIDMKSVPKNLWRPDNDNPIAWRNQYGKGRVFYTALGHADHVWRDPRFQQHILGGLRDVCNLPEDGKSAK
jgi:type 1 glutamine amidotransferase